MTQPDIEESFKDFIPANVARRQNGGEPSYPIMRSRTDEFDRLDDIADHLLAATFDQMMTLAGGIIELLPAKDPPAFALASALVQWARQQRASQP